MPAGKAVARSAGMLELQRRGYGQAKAIPSIEMAATGIDSVIAITGASCLESPDGGCP